MQVLHPGDAILLGSFIPPQSSQGLVLRVTNNGFFPYIVSERIPEPTKPRFYSNNHFGFEVSMLDAVIGSMPGARYEILSTAGDTPVSPESYVKDGEWVGANKDLLNDDIDVIICQSLTASRLTVSPTKLPTNLFCLTVMFFRCQQPWCPT